MRNRHKWERAYPPGESLFCSDALMRCVKCKIEVKKSQVRLGGLGECKGTYDLPRWMRPKRRAYIRKYYQENKKRIDESRKRYRKEHVEAERIWAQRGYQRLAKAWKGNIRIITREIIKKSEAVAPNILRKEGFVDIINIHGKAVFDYFAKRNGHMCGIDVTTAVKKELRKQHRQMAEYFGLKIFLLLIKPDFSLYRLVEIPQGQKSFSMYNARKHAHEMKKLDGDLLNVSV